MPEMSIQSEGIASAKALGYEQAREFAEQQKGQGAWRSVSDGERLGDKTTWGPTGHGKAEADGFVSVSLL